MAGESVDLAWYEDWLAMVRAATAAGRLFSRVRVVSLPLTDYGRFALWGARYTREAGDDIRYLTRGQADASELPKHDYWLFDSRLLVTMHFATDDRFIYAEVIDDPQVIVEHNYWRDVAKHRALTPEDFIAHSEQRDV